MTAEVEAVESLVELGLTEYEARCFVALTQLSEGTASEISEIADVPQSRVYDVAEELHQRGLVDVQESEPRRYFAMPVQLSLKRLRQEYSDNLDAANRHLEDLESREMGEGGAWEIASRQDVRNRVLMHVDNAEDEVYLVVAHDELLEEEVLDALVSADDRDVSVFVEVPSASARETVHEATPDVAVAVSDLPLEGMTPDDRDPGRLLMVDRDTILMSARHEGLVPNRTEETGLWGTEVGHGLVVWLRSLLVDRLDRLSFQSATS